MKVGVATKMRQVVETTETPKSSSRKSNIQGLDSPTPIQGHGLAQMRACRGLVGLPSFSDRQDR